MSVIPVQMAKQKRAAECPAFQRERQLLQYGGPGSHSYAYKTYKYCLNPSFLARVGLQAPENVLPALGPLRPSARPSRPGGAARPILWPIWKDQPPLACRIMARLSVTRLTQFLSAC
jgi:hypothetical protein